VFKVSKMSSKAVIRCGLAIQLLFCASFCSAQLSAAAQNVATENKLVRDPTIPLGTITARQAASPSYHLMSILISERRRTAIINGQRLREGQLIVGSDGVRVKRILAQAVIVEQGEKTWDLRLSSQQIRTPHQN